MTDSRISVCYLIIVVFGVLACGGNDNSLPATGTTESASQNGAPGVSGQVDLGGKGGNGEGVIGGSGGSDTAPASCCNGQLDENEQCDDGCNGDDNDGCTNLCTYTCTDDASCDDVDVCNGQETCDQTTHSCKPGLQAENGKTCGVGMACINGACTDIKCEQSDDCVSECDPLATCDPDTGACKPGRPIAENAICDNGEGYCQSWICVRNNCGDGVQEPNEECDLGDQNGTIDSSSGTSCTESCTKYICGNNEIEGDEQCDDGNRTNMDGCDKFCKLELVYRMTRLVITTEAADPMCEFADSVHQGNAMSKTFPDRTILDLQNAAFVGILESGQMNVLLYYTGMDDPTASTEDPNIMFGQMLGVLDAEWGTQPELDFPMKADLASLDEVDDTPESIMPVELVIEGDKTLLRTTRPITVFFVSLLLHRTMSYVEVDSPRSAMPNTGSVAVPESLGGADDEEAHGYICGAIPFSNYKTQPLSEVVAAMCTEDYDWCREGETPENGDCDSALEVLLHGCTSILGIPLMVGLGEGDADIDGDGEIDGFSVVARFSARRVRLQGAAVAPPVQPGCNCGCLCANCSKSWSCDGADCASDCTVPCTEVCESDPKCGSLTQGVGGCYN